MHRLFHALDEVVPGLGALVQAAFSPIGAAISIAAMALRAFHEKIKEFNQEMSKAEEEAAKPCARTIETQRDSVIRADTAPAQFKDRLTQAAAGQQTEPDKTNQAAAALKLNITETGRLEEALKHREMQGLDLAHDAGLMSDAACCQAMLEIEEKHAERKRALDEREAMSEITANRRAIEEVQTQQPALEAKAAGAAELDVREAMATAQAVRKGQTVSPEAQQRLMDTASTIEGRRLSPREAPAGIRRTTDTSGGFAEEVTKLASAVQTLGAGHLNLRGQVTLIQQQVQQLQTQLQATHIPGT